MSIKFQNSNKEERHVDCELCDQRYWGYDIDIYIDEVMTKGESFLICHEHVREALKKAEDPRLLTSAEIARLVNALKRKED
jgi:hypothetical protein